MRTRAALFAAAAVVLAAGLPASAAGGAPVLSTVSVDDAEISAGTPVTVAGSMIVDTQAGAVLWTDTTMAGDIPTFDYNPDPNLDLVTGSVEHARPGDPLTLRIKVAPAIGADSGPKPYQWFRWAFQLEQIWYFAEFHYRLNGSVGAWSGYWYYCRLALGSACVHNTTPAYPVNYDAAARTYTGKIPISELAKVQPDGTLGQDTMRPFSSQYPPEAGYDFDVLLNTQDRAPAFTPYDLPLETVFLGIAPAGTNPGDVTYAAQATVTSTAGSLEVPFAGELSTEDLAPGAYELFVKGCFGPCTTTRVPITISG